MKDKKNIHGFKAPADYFESFDERLFDRMEEMSVPEEHGFVVPEGYFSTVEDNVLQRLNTSKIKTKVIPLYKHKTFLYITSIAACAAIIFSVTLTKSSISNTINDVQISNIDDYIERGNLDLDTYDLMAMLGDEEIEEISAENIIFSEDNLEDYLMDNLDDTSLLTE